MKYTKFPFPYIVMELGSRGGIIRQAGFKTEKAADDLAQVWHKVNQGRGTGYKCDVQVVEMVSLYEVDE